jgi:hypothetical protein
LKAIDRSTFAAAILLLTMAVVPLILYCSRTNPMDAKSGNYIPGAKPTAHFSSTGFSGYIGDSVTLFISCTDTASGGGPGTIGKIYLGWNNASTFNDSIRGSKTMEYVYKKIFPLGTWTIRLQAVDGEGQWSDTDSTVLVVLPSEPRIDSVRFGAKVEIHTADTLFVSASDVGGVVQTYLWALDGAAFNDSSHSGVFAVSFSDTGLKKILVKVRDDNKIESPTFPVFINVHEKPDTVGPVMSFVNVRDNDTVSYGTLGVYIQALDEHPVSSVSANGVALQLSGGLWKGEVPLEIGGNVLIASAIDSKGNPSEKRVLLYFFPDKNDNSPPVLLFKTSSHTNDSVGATPYTIKVTAIDISGIAKVMANGHAMAFDTTDSTYFLIADLQKGKNLFAISATDKKGNTGTDTLTVYFEPTLGDKTPPTY